MAQQVRQESEFIKRVEDFARYMAPEYINDSDNPRSLTIIAADCLDKKNGKHAMAHVMIGDGRVGRCALRSMMRDNGEFAQMVHELCQDDDVARSVEDLDQEIARKQRRLKLSVCIIVGLAVWSAAIAVLALTGIVHWSTSVANLLLMAWCEVLVYSDVKAVRSNIATLKRIRKQAAGRQKIMGRMSEFAEFLRRMRAQLEEDAGDDDDE